MSNKQKARGVEDKIKMNPLDTFEPIRISTDVELPEVEMVTLFTIDEKEYKIPKDIGPGYGLRFMRNVLDTGSMEAAQYQAMVELLGRDGYDALADCPHVTKEHFASITKLIQQLALGAVDTKN